jgi:ADP-L-glycero-D-manno-heptose 6-epimerase
MGAGGDPEHPAFRICEAYSGTVRSSVLVTGAAGALGGDLVRACLASGRPVTAVDRRPAQPAELDVSPPELDASVPGLDASLSGLEDSLPGSDASLSRLEDSLSGSDASLRGLDGSLPGAATGFGTPASPPPRVDVIRADPDDRDLLERVRDGEFIAVLHLDAAVVSSALALAKACAVSGTRFLFTSTAEIYGAVLKRDPVPERALEDRLWCSGPLSAAAHAAWDLEREMRQFGWDVLPWAGFRLTTVVGRGQTLIAGLAERAASGSPVAVFEDSLTAARDLIPAAAVTSVLTTLIDAEVPAGIYNLGSGHAVSVAKMLEWCAEFRDGSGLDVRLVPNPSPITFQRWMCADMTLLRSVLPELPVISRDDLRGAALSVYRSYLEHVG